jgi:hypothetical protein
VGHATRVGAERPSAQRRTSNPTRADPAGLRRAWRPALGEQVDEGALARRADLDRPQVGLHHLIVAVADRIATLGFGYELDEAAPARLPRLITCARAHAGRTLSTEEVIRLSEAPGLPGRLVIALVGADLFGHPLVVIQLDPGCAAPRPLGGPKTRSRGASLRVICRRRAWNEGDRPGRLRLCGRAAYT